MGLSSAILRTKLHDVRARAQRYFRSLGWLIGRGLARGKLKVIVVIAANFLGITTAASSYGLIIQYARHMQKSRPLMVKGITLAHPGEWQGMLLVSVVTLVLGCFSAGAIYLGEWLIQKITRQFEESSQLEIFHILSDPRCRGWSRYVDGTKVVPEIMNICQAGARFTAFALRFLLQGILPILTLLVATGYMVWQAPLLSALLIPFALAYLPILYLINTRIARCHKEFRANAKIVNPRFNAEIGAIAGSDGPVSEEEVWRREIFESEAYDLNKSNFYERILAREKLDFCNSLLFILCMLFLFMYFGSPWKRHDQSWAELVTVLIALRFVWRGLRQTTSTFTAISRFFPEFHKYSVFVDRARALCSKREEKAAPSRQATMPEEFVVSARPGDIDQQGGSMPVRKGRRYLLITCERKIRDALSDSALGILANAGVPAPAVVTEIASFHMQHPYLQWATPELNALGHAPDADRLQQLRDYLRRLPVQSDFTGDLDEPELPNPRTDEARYALSAAHCVLRGRPWVFLAYSALERQGEDFRQAFLAELEGRYLFIVSTPNQFAPGEQSPLTDTFDGVIVTEGREVIGCGSVEWFHEHFEPIAQKAGSSKGEGGEGEEDDMLELEMQG